MWVRKISLKWLHEDHIGLDLSEEQEGGHSVRVRKIKFWGEVRFLVVFFSCFKYRRNIQVISILILKLNKKVIVIILK